MLWKGVFEHFRETYHVALNSSIVFDGIGGTPPSLILINTPAYRTVLDLNADDVVDIDDEYHQPQSRRDDRVDPHFE